MSLAVVREGLLRLVGEGLAERLPNRGFVVPNAGDARWQVIAEARSGVEPLMLRMSIGRGDLEWAARVRASHHRLAGNQARNAEAEHQRLERLALNREGEAAAAALPDHVSITAAVLSPDKHSDQINLST